jgi:hypothetical protein
VRSELAITAWTNYRDVIGLYVTPHLGSRRLVDLSPMDIKAWHTHFCSSTAARTARRWRRGPCTLRTACSVERLLMPFGGL